MSRRVAIVAGGTTRKWGAYPGTLRDIISETAKDVFDSNQRVKAKDIQGFVFCSVFPERSAFQSHTATWAAESAGVSPERLFCRVENMCGSGTVGIRTAYSTIATGLADLVMVLGAEKMYVPNPPEIALNMLSGVDREWEGSVGLTAPVQFALAAQAHMRKYGTTERQLAMVSAKNHRNAARNPYAQFPKPCSVEDVLASKPVATPLKIFDCSSISDGGAAVILASEELAKELTDCPIYILGTSQAASGFNYANIPEDWADWDVLSLAAKNAYQMAGIKAKDINVAEVHDCFSISEIIEYEALGFCPPGEGGNFVATGQSDYNGQVVVNPRGGLIGCGHPLGATGVAQAIEIFRQLRNESEGRQVPNAKVGLNHNLSGLSEHHIIIYGRGEVLG